MERGQEESGKFFLDPEPAEMHVDQCEVRKKTGTGSKKYQLATPGLLFPSVLRHPFRTHRGIVDVCVHKVLDVFIASKVFRQCLIFSTSLI